MNLPLVLSIVVLAIAIAATVYMALIPHCKEFTEFYILGPQGKAGDYPTRLKVGQVGEVIVGVRNHWCREERYRLVVLFDNETVYSTTITLAYNQTWLHRLQFTPTRPGRAKLELFLYKDDTETPYRTLHLWVEVEQP